MRVALGGPQPFGDFRVGSRTPVAGRSARFEELIAVLTRTPSPALTRRSPNGWGPPKGTSASPSTASGGRYGLLLREEIAATVGDAAQVDDEIQTLFAALEG